MPRCSVCNNRYDLSHLDENRVCRACADNQKKKFEGQLKENIDALSDGRGKPQYQRIYDAFIRTYPDAVITGVACYADPVRILVYLDGQPMYYATFDPLRSAAKLESYDDAPASSQPSDAPASKSVESDRCQTLAVTASAFSLLFALMFIAVSNHPTAALFFGFASIVSLIGSAFGKGSVAIFAGMMMVLAGMLSDLTLVIPGLIIIYGSTKY